MGGGYYLQPTQPMEPPRKKIKTSDALDDDAIENIICFLPIKCAVQIGHTSKRHQHSWKRSRNLDFGKNMAIRQTQDYIGIVDRILSLHIAPKIRNFKLYFDPMNNYSKFNHWINFATSKGVEEVDLDFVATGKQSFDLPDCLLHCPSLVTLKLSHLQLKFNDRYHGLGCLTNLVLRDVVITEEMVQVVFRNCLRLEVLELIRCHGVEVLKVSAIDHNKFKLLKVTRCSRISLINVNAPSLLSIHYCGALHNFPILDNVPKLKDVILSFKAARGYPNIVGRLKNIDHVNTLSVNSNLLEGLRRAPFCLPNLKELNLVMEWDSYCNLYDIALFVSNCSRLESLSIDLKDFSFYCGPYWENFDKIPFEKISYTFNHLKSVTLKGFKLEPYEIQLVKFFLEKTLVLETLTLITLSSKRMKDVESFRTMFLSYRRSPLARLRILSSRGIECASSQLILSGVTHQIGETAKLLTVR